MYTFSIEKDHIPLVSVTIVDGIIEKDAYFKSLVEKCFERVFIMIREEATKKESLSEEIDLEEDD